jgi:hypothetical protein
LLAISSNKKVFLYESSDWCNKDNAVFLKSFDINQPAKKIAFLNEENSKKVDLFVTTINGRYSAISYTKPVKKNETINPPSGVKPSFNVNTLKTKDFQLPKKPSTIPQTLPQSPSKSNGLNLKPAETSSIDLLTKDSSPTTNKAAATPIVINKDPVSQEKNVSPITKRLSVNTEDMDTLISPVKKEKEEKEIFEEEKIQPQNESFKKKNEKMKSFQPSSTPTNKKKSILFWNEIGKVCSINSSSPVIDVKFCDLEKYKNINLKNNIGYTMSYMSKYSLVLSSKRNENLKTNSVLHHYPLVSSDFHCKFTKTMEGKEEIEAICCGDNW